MTPISEKSRGNKFLREFMKGNVLEDNYSGIPENKSPFVNISESDGNFSLEIGIPGFKRSDLEIMVRDTELVISGSMKKKKPGGEEHFMRHDFDYTTFRKSFQLPEMIDLKKIKAKYENGILRINLPKKEGYHIAQSIINIE